jgi:hypothetical protein
MRNGGKLNKTIFFSAILLATYAVYSQTYNQGLVVQTVGDSVEIIINKKSYAAPVYLEIPLKEGTYSIVGKRLGYFPDVEYEVVEKDKIDTVTLEPKKYRFHGDGAFSYLVGPSMPHESSDFGFSGSAGIKSITDYFGGAYMWMFYCESFVISFEYARLFLIGNTCEFGAGGQVGFTNLWKQGYGYNGIISPEVPFLRAMHFSPKLSINAGFEHLRLSLSVSYLICVTHILQMRSSVVLTF